MKFLTASNLQALISLIYKLFYHLSDKTVPAILSAIQKNAQMPDILNSVSFVPEKSIFGHTASIH
jgi:hypothetical protein